jgi:hypothetical protein
MSQASKSLLLTLAATFAFVCLQPPGASGAFAEVAITFDELRQQWKLDNGTLQVVMEFRGSGLVLTSIRGAGRTWAFPAGRPSSPVRFSVDSVATSGETGFRLAGQRIEGIAHGGRRLTVVLEKLDASAQVAVEFEMFPDHPVLRQRVALTNHGQSDVYVTAADLLPYRFQLDSDPLDVFHIDQWDPTTTTSFQLHRERLARISHQ